PIGAKRTPRRFDPIGDSRFPLMVFAFPASPPYPQFTSSGDSLRPQIAILRWMPLGGKLGMGLGERFLDLARPLTLWGHGPTSVGLSCCKRSVSDYGPRRFKSFSICSLCSRKCRARFR